MELIALYSIVCFHVGAPSLSSLTSSPKSTAGDGAPSVVWMFDPVNDNIVGLPWLGVRYGITEEEKVKIGMAVSWRLTGKCLQELERL